MARAALVERFSAHLATSGLLAGPGRALLAVSGGPDSMALLDLCVAVAAERRIELAVAHADHGIHPRSAEVAAQVVRTVRERYRLEATVGRLALGAGAGESHARTARYEFLRAVQQDRGARWLVTAHHADDQAETVLLRLLRGSAPAGLAGIAAEGPHGLVRPLLPFRRAELAVHAREAGLTAFDDPANADPRHTRSWLRTVIIPQIESRIGDATFEALTSVAAHASRELDAWDAVLGQLPALDVRVTEGRADVARAALAGYDSALAARLLRAAAHRAGLMLAPAQAERVVQLAVRGVSGKRLELGDDLVAEVAFERLVITPRPLTPDPRPLVGAAGEARFGRFTVRWVQEQAPDRLARDGWTTWIAGGALEVRHAPPGARIVPLGGNGHRGVARLLMEGRVPRADRAGWPLIVRDGEPVWIPGICRGNTAVPPPGTLAVRMDFAPAV